MAKKSKKSPTDTSTSKKDDAKQDAASKERQKKDTAKAKAAAEAVKKAAARAAALAEDAKKARKVALKAAKAADKAETKASDAGAATPKAKPDERELLKLALRSTEAKLTHAERKVEALQQQLDDRARLADLQAEEALEDAVVDAAVQATVVEAVLEAELVADATISSAEIIEVVAVELDEVLADAAPEPEPSHDGDAAAAAEVFAAADPGAEPTVTTTELTPPLPETPADDDPSESWTLLRLRQLAKQRGMTGTSNLPKAALLERLRAS